MIRPIVQDPVVLSTKCSEAPASMAEGIVRDLIDTARAASNCAGLAAIQIGYPFNACVIKVGADFRAFVNPVIIARGGGVKALPEGCLSFPGKTVVVRRAKEIKLSTGEKFSGFTARVLQHEVDHMRGISHLMRAAGY